MILISTIHFKIILRQDVPQYVIDFFSKGIQHEGLSSVLYSYRFTFDNSCNIAGKTQMLFQQDKTGKYHLAIDHQFDFNDEMEVAKGIGLWVGLRNMHKMMYWQVI